MRRLIVRVFPAISVLLYAAACAMWGRSYRHYDYAFFNSSAPTPERSIGIFSGRGKLWLTAESRPKKYPLRLTRWEFGSIERTAESEQLIADSGDYCLPLLPHITAVQIQSTAGSRFRSIAIPYLVIVATAFGPFGYWLALRWGWLPRRRARVGVCATCGYDIRATPEQCPECGTSPIAEAGLLAVRQ